jgi:hypothetical protein
MPLSQMVAPYSPTQTRSAHRGGRGSQAASTPFHTGYEHDRGAQPATTKGNQDEGALPDRGRGAEADLPRDPKRGPAMDPNPRLDKGHARVQDSLRRPTTQLNHQTTAYTDRRTPSGGGLTPVCELAAFDLATWGFLLGLIRRLVAGGGPWFGELGPLRRRTALSFWRQVLGAIPRKHWRSRLALASSWTGSSEASQPRATVVVGVRSRSSLSTHGVGSRSRTDGRRASGGAPS